MGKPPPDEKQRHKEAPHFLSLQSKAISLYVQLHHLQQYAYQDAALNNGLHV